MPRRIWAVVSIGFALLYVGARREYYQHRTPTAFARFSELRLL